ncbi:SHOCT domain-containing protein [Pseudovibrio sp. Tun.PSC04-5.I4]|uniref:SHOCT domain-containing protein n=1 Tax=Pseudovibrio sp. Tun.PSC04-5.I4 TaxID=1798213 RepID=UPI00087EE3CA|nr:SHOCT domain-containing protein [Pseudovibrio sp. Tun.PSC04-5.I4]SDR47397.1 putative membrane protein [Pseudovibrio sp. Tun.PSC04-5.I4]
MYHQTGMHGFGFFPFPLVLILLLVIAYFIARSYGYLGQASSPKTSTPEPKSSTSEALDILNRRFAKGEIDEEEFQKRSQVLRLNL